MLCQEYARGSSLCHYIQSKFNDADSSDTILRLNLRGSPQIVFHLHRVILSQCLTFERMLTDSGYFSERTKTDINLTVDVRDMDSKCFTLFLRMLYTENMNEVQEIKEDYIRLFILCDMYGFFRGRSFIMNHMKSVIESDFLDLIHLAVELTNRDIAKMCLRWLQVIGCLHSNACDMLNDLPTEVAMKALCSSSCFLSDRERVFLQMALSLKDASSEMHDIRRSEQKIGQCREKYPLWMSLAAFQRLKGCDSSLVLGEAGESAAVVLKRNRCDCLVNAPMLAMYRQEQTIQWRAHLMRNKTDDFWRIGLSVECSPSPSEPQIKLRAAVVLQIADSQHNYKVCEQICVVPGSMRTDLACRIEDGDICDPYVAGTHFSTDKLRVHGANLIKEGDPVSFLMITVYLCEDAISGGTETCLVSEMEDGC